MKQHVVTDQVAIRYADGVDHVWSTWEPALRRCERLLGGQAWRSSLEPQELAEQLRRSQYHAHTASEFASGLVPPPSAISAHALLIAVLAGCRDVLGVIALRAELGELDEETAEIGLHAVDGTRDAFRGARSTTALVHAWVADDQVDPAWLHSGSQPSRGWSIALWMMAAVCVALMIVLAMQLFVLNAGPA